MEQNIIFTSKDNISQRDIKKLKSLGVTVIEVDRLHDLKFKHEIDVNEMFEASMETVSKTYDSHKAYFFNILYDKMKRKPKQTP